MRVRLVDVRISDTYGAVFRTAAEICALMPAGLAAGLAAAGAQVEWACRPAKRRRLAENLAHAVGRAPDDPFVRRLVHRNMTAGARRAAGLLWAFARPGLAVGRIAITPPRALEDMLASGRGAVLSSAHFGPFEAAGTIARVLPEGVTLAVMTDENAIGRGMHAIRQRMGLTVVPADGDLRTLLRILASGGLVVVLGDLHRPGMRGHRVRFLGSPYILPGGVAALARMSQAPIVPFAVYPDGARRWRLELAAPIAPPARHGGADDELRATQDLADAFTRVIRAMPQQWDAVDPIPWQPEDRT